MSIIISLAATSAFFKLVAKAELLLGYNTHYFSSMWNSLWYTFGTLLGESITKDISLEKNWALR